MNEETITQLTVVVEQAGLGLESAHSLKSAFAPFFDQAEEWRKKVELINITDASQTREMKLARDSRLALREIRIKAEKTRKQLKEDSVKRGRAIDGVYNVLEFLIDPLEKRLLEQEKFVERLEEKRKADLKLHREELLAPYQVDTSFYSLGEMPDETFSSLLETIKIAHETKIAAARKAEEDRIVAERAKVEEEARIRAENERLKKEAEAKEVALKAERQAAEKARKEADEKARKEREAIEAKARAEREKVEAEAKKENERLAAIAKKQKEEANKAAKIAAEAAAKERKAREEAEAKLKAAKEAEAKKLAEEAEAKRKAAAAPDKTKLQMFAAQIRVLNIPTMATKEGQAIIAEVKSQNEKYAAWIEKKATAL